MKKNRMITALAVFGALVSCETEDLQAPQENSVNRVEVETPEARFVNLPEFSKSNLTTTTSSKGETYGTEIYMAEYISADGAQAMGNTVFFNNRGNKQLGGDFVPELQFLSDGTTDVTFYVDQNRPSADLDVAETTMAINGAMNTWDRVQCSDLGMTEVPYDGRPTGLVSAIFGFGGSFDYVADVTHSGWLPGQFFDILEPGGSNFILGVTFTIIWTINGEPIDVDNNGKIDVAWREIYYNDAFPWAIGSTFDVETIALHEAGHGLSQGHFGKAFLSNGNGKVHFAPRAVMNAAYSGVQTAIMQTDNAGHCSNWGQWPNN
ncbi:MAG: hypothetical protein ACR2MM_05220 [Flavobacteriaceae bacterium]